MKKTRILLTGFEPFGKSKVNPSEKVVRSLAGVKLDAINLITCILPVNGNLAPESILRTIETTSPDFVVCLGEAPKRHSISIERVAINLLDFRIPDNNGNQFIDAPVVEGGPDAYFVSLPVRKILEAVQNENIPAELSLTAGTYLCNQVLYEVLHFISKKNMPTRAGFIHLPSLPEQVVNNPGASMGADISITAITAVLKTLII
jgi:pyroglutamyl-peptidase